MSLEQAFELFVVDGGVVRCAQPDRGGDIDEGGPVVGAGVGGGRSRDADDEAAAVLGEALGELRGETGEGGLAGAIDVQVGEVDAVGVDFLGGGGEFVDVGDERGLGTEELVECRGGFGGYGDTEVDGDGAPLDAGVGEHIDVGGQCGGTIVADGEGGGGDDEDGRVLQGIGIRDLADGDDEAERAIEGGAAEHRDVGGDFDDIGFDEGSARCECGAFDAEPAGGGVSVEAEVALIGGDRREADRERQEAFALVQAIADLKVIERADSGDSCRQRREFVAGVGSDAATVLAAAVQE